MSTWTNIRRVGRWVSGGAVLAAAGYASYVAATWLRYGQPAPAKGADVDALLDRFIPEYGG